MEYIHWQFIQFLIFDISFNSGLCGYMWIYMYVACWIMLSRS